jgi:GNAT superfamily N-acetyltransferase
MRAREFLPERTEPYQGLDLEMEFDEDEIWVTARDASGRELGHVLFVDTGDELVPQDLEVEERFRGQGIARVMYDWVKSKGYRIRRSNSQTRAGAEFWNRNRPGENVWEQGVAEGIDPDVYDDLDARTIVRAAKSVMPDIRGRDTDEGYVHLTSGRGLDLYIGASVADGEISINIGSGGGIATSGTDQGAVTAIIKAVYDTAVRKCGQKLGLTYDSMNENFADGKRKGRSRPGRVKRSGASCKGSVTDLRARAKKYGGERGRMYHWCANMKGGRKKAAK